MSRFKPHSIRASSTSAVALAKVLIDTILWTADWSGHCTFAKYYKKTNPRTWEFGRSWSLVVILLSHHEVPGITCPPLLAYEINPLNLSFIRLSKWISGIGSHVIPCTSWWPIRITIKLQLIGKSRLTLSVLSYLCKTVGVCSMN